MKYLDIAALSGLNAKFEAIDVGDSIIQGRIEAYSCKTVGSDKRLYKSIENELAKSPHSKSPINNNYSKSPANGGLSVSANGSVDHLSVSPFGPLSQPSSRKTMIYLIATLNATYLDYDFSDVQPEQFRKEPNLHMVINSINTTLSSIIPDYNSEIRDELWRTVDMEVDTPKCDIYSYIPDIASDPFTEEGTIWSFNYFFYNRILKRIIYFTCRATNKTANSGDRAAIAASTDYYNDEGIWEFDDDIKV